ncbi:hypothetical protein [Paenibacillus tundrae]|uniref:hypothetical protein n=1 Tax=Paenibacillus tundrae TaxID=528187 RepID=UPI0030CC4BAD
MNTFSKGIARINNMNWSKSASVDDPSHMALLQEYIRRAALLITFYELNTSYPFFKASQALGYEPNACIAEKCPALGELKNNFIKGTCEAYLEWLLLIDSGNEVAVKFHDLYERIILLIEKGGTMRRQHGEIITGGYAFPLATAEYMSNQEPIDISDAGLRAWANQ